MPAQPIEYPAPCFVGGFFHWRLGQSGFRIAHRLASVCIRNLLEDVALLLDTSVIRQEAQTEFERVEFKSLIHVVAVPIAKPAHPFVDRSQHGFLKPLSLLLLSEFFDTCV